MVEIDCVICGRKNVGIPNQRIHSGWCWWCIKNKMEGRGFDSYGKPLEESIRHWEDRSLSLDLQIGNTQWIE